MHQQFRIVLTSTPSGGGKDGPYQADDGGPEIDAAPIEPRAGGLAALAQAIGTRVNIRAVSGDRIEAGGELRLAVDDADIPAVRQILKDGGNRYRYTIWNVEHGHLPDEPGSLGRWADRLARKGFAIDSIMVGTPEKDAGSDGDDRWEAGDVPVQVTTFRASGSEDVSFDQVD